jgi:hypothetical protein
MRNIRDFTYTQLVALYSVLDDAGYRILSFERYMRGETLNKKFAILRHDVDRKKENALKMAEIEYERGISSSYYFRYPYTFDSDLISKISAMDHEIGYHYEVLAKSRGDKIKGVKLFSKELQEFRKFYDVKTCCPHGSPLSPFDNRELWSDNDFRTFGIEGDAQLSVRDPVIFFSDTGRSWDNRNNMRDFVVNSSTATHVRTTDDLIKHICLVSPPALYLSIHPERWTSGGLDWYFQRYADVIYNTGRIIIKGIR